MLRHSDPQPPATPAVGVGSEGVKAATENRMPAVAAIFESSDCVPRSRSKRPRVRASARTTGRPVAWCQVGGARCGPRRPAGRRAAGFLSVSLACGALRTHLVPTARAGQLSMDEPQCAVSASSRQSCGRVVHQWCIIFISSCKCKSIRDL